MNTHWIAGENSSQHATRRGWTPGTTLTSPTGRTVTITAIGRQIVLAWDHDLDNEITVMLRFDEWEKQ